jgi:hypothetical protein
MIHSIDPLHEEAINNAIASQPDTTKHQHTHPPGAIPCTLCNEENTPNGVNGNNIFHTAKMAVQAHESNNNPLVKPYNGSVDAQNNQVFYRTRI